MCSRIYIISCCCYFSVSILDKKDTKNHFQTSDMFVNESLLIWAEVNFSDNIPSLEHYKTQRLWNNSLIRIDRKPTVYFRKWLAKGMLTVESLIKDETSFLSYTKFLNKYYCKSRSLAYSGIIATLKTIGRMQIWRAIRRPERVAWKRG